MPGKISLQAPSIHGYHPYPILIFKRDIDIEYFRYLTQIRRPSCFLIVIYLIEGPMMLKSMEYLHQIHELCIRNPMEGLRIVLSVFILVSGINKVILNIL